MRQRRRHTRRQRQHRQAIERTMRLLIVGIGRIPLDTQQHRRHPVGQRDLPRSRLLGLLKLHIRRRKPHRFPIEPAFQEHRPPRIPRALMMALHLRHQTVILIRTKAPLPVSRLVGDRSRRPCGIIQQSLRPTRRAIVHINRHRRRLHRRKPIMIILWMEVPQMADLRMARHLKPMLAPANGIFIPHGPTISTRHHPHSV